MARRRRRKAAPAGRVLATGLSATAMLGIVSVLASQPPPSWELKTTAGGADTGTGDEGALAAAALATAAPASTVPVTSKAVTTIVTRVEQRIIKVYDDGTPASNASGNPAGQAPAAAAPVNANVAPVGGQPPPTTQAAPQPGSPPAPPATVAPPPPAPTTTAAPVPKCTTSKC